MAIQYSTVSTEPTAFRRSSAAGHTWVLYFLAVLNSAAANTGMEMCLWHMKFTFFGYYEVEDCKPHGRSIFNLLRHCGAVLHNVWMTLLSRPQCAKVPSSPGLPTIGHLMSSEQPFFWGEVTFHCDFGLHFPDNWWSLTFFLLRVGQIRVLLLLLFW